MAKPDAILGWCYVKMSNIIKRLRREEKSANKEYRHAAVQQDSKLAKHTLRSIGKEESTHYSRLGKLLKRLKS